MLRLKRQAWGLAVSMREKTSWIAVGTTLVVWTYYFAVLWGDALAGRIDGEALRNLFLVCMGISLAVMLGLNIAMAVASRQSMDAPPDELERQIEGKADRIGFKVLELAVPIVLVAALLNVEAMSKAMPGDAAGSVAVVMANGVLMVMVVVELVREALKIALFRMTA